MANVVKLEVNGMTFEEALALAVLNSKEDIARKVDCCKKSDDGKLEIWCEFAQQDVTPWCKWFTGENCSCKTCENVSMPKATAWFAYIFHLIEEDDLALEIAQELEECQDLHGELIPIDRYRKDILETYAIVKDLISNGKLKHPRILVSLWKYVNAHE